MMRAERIRETGWQMDEEVNRDKTGEADGMNPGSWLQRRRNAYLNERPVIFKEKMVGGRERVTTDEDRALRGGWREIRLWR